MAAIPRFMNTQATSAISRRTMLKGSVSAAALLFAQHPLSLFGGPAMDEGKLIPFLDVQPTTRKSTNWQNLTSWITKNENVYVVSHYGDAKVDAPKHTLEVSGLVKKPKTLTMDEIKKRRRKTVTATLECGGNGASPAFMGAIGNVRWTGTPLVDLLEECQPLNRAIEV